MAGCITQVWSFTSPHGSWNILTINSILSKYSLTWCFDWWPTALSSSPSVKNWKYESHDFYPDQTIHSWFSLYWRAMTYHSKAGVANSLSQGTTWGTEASVIGTVNGTVETDWSVYRCISLLVLYVKNGKASHICCLKSLWSWCVCVWAWVGVKS